MEPGAEGTFVSVGGAFSLSAPSGDRSLESDIIPLLREFDLILDIILLVLDRFHKLTFIWVSLNEKAAKLNSPMSGEQFLLLLEILFVAFENSWTTDPFVPTRKETWSTMSS